MKQTATCAMKDEESGQTFTEQTSSCGDFWVKELEDDRSYTLSFGKDGFTEIIDNVTTDIDRGLDDIPMDMSAK